MMRTLLPIVLIVLAGLIFFYLADPLLNQPKVIDSATGRTRGGVKALNQEIAVLNEALGNARAIQTKFADLRDNVYNQIKDEDLARLDKLMPNSVDNVQLIIDINTIAKNNAMLIKNVYIKADDNNNNNQLSGSNPTPADNLSAATLTGAGSLTRGTVLIGFSVAGSYEAFNKFLKDLADSLRIVDVNSLSFTADDRDFYQYNVELRTYWLK